MPPSLPPSLSQLPPGLPGQLLPYKGNRQETPGCYPRKGAALQEGHSALTGCTAAVTARPQSEPARPGPSQPEGTAGPGPAPGPTADHGRPAAPLRMAAWASPPLCRSGGTGRAQSARRGSAGLARGSWRSPARRRRDLPVPAAIIAITGAPPADLSPGAELLPRQGRDRRRRGAEGTVCRG